MKAKNLLMINSFLGLTLIFSGCQETQVYEKEALKLGMKKNIEIPPNVVCDPFAQTDNGQTNGLFNGLEGQIRLLNTDVAQTDLKNNLNTYLDLSKSHPTGAVIYANSLDVAVRAFDQGFPFKSGDLVLDANGDALIEWFALSFKSKLKVPEDGNYQFATLSDDGVQLYVDGKLIIDNPNVHAPTIDCSAHGQYVYLSKDQEVDVLINYFQGPKFHIALQLLWRKVDLSNVATLSYAACGKSAPGASAQNQDGFTTVPAEAFVLGNNKINPCNGK
jgi:hypothetical protein